MIVVRKEDQTKIIGLSVILLAVVGFVGLRVSSVLSSSKKPMVARATDRQPAATTQEFDLEVKAAFSQMSELPTANDQNPFRSVLIDSKGSRQLAAQPKALPGLGMGPDGMAPMPVGGMSIQPTQPIVRLDGVVTGRRGSAIVTSNNQTEVLTVGQSINGYTVIFIDKTSATFASKQGQVKLMVGDETKPPAPTPAPTSPDILPLAGSTFIG